MIEWDSYPVTRRQAQFDAWFAVLGTLALAFALGAAVGVYTGQSTLRPRCDNPATQPIAPVRKMT